MSTTTTASEKQSGRHPVNVGHLVMGIAFLGLVGVWALIQGDVVGNGDVRWLLPVPWVLAGLAGLLAIGMSGSRRWTTRQTGWITPTEATDTTVFETETPEAAEPEAPEPAEPAGTDEETPPTSPRGS